MPHRVTEHMKATVTELHALREQIEVRLELASGEAREEWSNLSGRIPPLTELDSGFVALAEATLDEMKTKVFRFSTILREGGGGKAAVRAVEKHPRRSARRTS